MRFLRVTTGFLLVLATLATTGIGSKSFALTADEFRADTWPHMKAVGYAMPIAFKLAAQDAPDEVRDLTLWMVRLYSQPGYLHDTPKRDDLVKLRADGYKGDEDIATILARYDGQKIPPGTLGAKTVIQLNQIESLRKEREFYSRLSRPPFNYSAEKIARARLQMENIERIADWVVTCMYRKRALAIDERGRYIAARHLAEWVHAPKWQIDVSKKLEDILQTSYRYEKAPHQRVPQTSVPCSSYLN